MTVKVQQYEDAKNQFIITTPEGIYFQADAVEAGCIRAHLKDSSESVAGSLEISGRSAFDRRTYAPKE